MTTYVNDYDLALARARFIASTCPNRLALVLVVDNLREWTDCHSDGWAYWAKPLAAAQRAIAEIDATTHADVERFERVDLTDDEMRDAVKPIKAFLTRQKVDADWRERILRAVTS